MNNSVLLSVQNMYKADAFATENGIPSLDLMESAGRAITREIKTRYYPCRVVVLCGPGNNGGDGFVVARQLQEQGWAVKVAALDTLENASDDLAINWQRWKGEVLPFSEQVIEGADLVIDAILGAGLSRPVEGTCRKMITALNEADVEVVSVDVPSGISGDTGRVFGAAVQADLTITFFRAKPGHFLLPGRSQRGELVVADIGIPEDALEEVKSRTFLNTPEIWLDKLPIAQAHDHKYSRGHLVILGGDKLTGAARLAARGARRIGVGLLTIACPSETLPFYGTDDPGNILHPVKNSSDLAILLEDSRKNVSLVGPGAGVSPETEAMVMTALRGPQSCVLDADALSVFEDRVEDLISGIEDPTLLTPHEGEFARLFDYTGDKVTRARKAALISGAVILLKGADTVIAAPDGRVAINYNATPNLATGGSGDVLAGFAAGLIAQGMELYEAACAAAWIHGAAGAAVGAGLIAEDIPEQVPMILSSFFEVE
ncbi:MAG: NAD(P)H-hydrate dehydratase [Rhodospirillales bacterium]|nr:NAD(P)H-hydrate dehydratase [Rhodospirillales bacterium]